MEYQLNVPTPSAGTQRQTLNPYKHELAGHTQAVRDVHFCHKDVHIVTASDDASLRLWNVESNFCVSQFRHDADSPVTGCDLNREQDRLLSSSWDETLRLWDIETGQEKFRAEHDSLLTGCALDRSVSEHIALSSCNNRTVCMWDLDAEAKKPLHTFSGHGSTVTACQVNAERNIVVSSSMDHTTIVWDLRMPHQVLIRLKDHVNVVCSCHLSQCGRYLVTGGYDRMAYVYDIAIGQYRTKGPSTLSHHEGSIGCCRHSPNGRYIVTCGHDNVFALWKTRDYSMHYKLKNGHDNWILAADFSSDEKWVATASKDCNVRIWTVESQPLETYCDPRKKLGLNVDKCTRCGREFSAVDATEDVNPDEGKTVSGWCVICRLKHPSRLFEGL